MYISWEGTCWELNSSQVCEVFVVGFDTESL